MKEALRHISNRKSAGCDGIPIELLKAGGEEAVKVMTGLCNYICIYGRGRNGRQTGRNRCNSTCHSIRKEIRRNVGITERSL